MLCSGDTSAAASHERRYHCQQRTPELEISIRGGPDAGSPENAVSNNLSEANEPRDP
jgi:hypothetical protein